MTHTPHQSMLPCKTCYPMDHNKLKGIRQRRISKTTLTSQLKKYLQRMDAILTEASDLEHDRRTSRRMSDCPIYHGERTNVY